jgi:hypothetical protein
LRTRDQAAILRLDLDARINIDEADQLVGIAGRVSLRDAAHAIEDGGFRVAAAVDGTLVMRCGHAMESPRGLPGADGGCPRRVEMRTMAPTGRC